jgi:hypothetical protein
MQMGRQVRDCKRRGARFLRAAEPKRGQKPAIKAPLALQSAENRLEDSLQ